MLRFPLQEGMNMGNEHLRETELLDYSSPSIQSLISDIKDGGISPNMMP